MVPSDWKRHFVRVGVLCLCLVRVGHGAEQDRPGDLTSRPVFEATATLPRLITYSFPVPLEDAMRVAEALFRSPDTKIRDETAWFLSKTHWGNLAEEVAHLAAKQFGAEQDMDVKCGLLRVMFGLAPTRQEFVALFRQTAGSSNEKLAKTASEYLRNSERALAIQRVEEERIEQDMAEIARLRRERKLPMRPAVAPKPPAASREAQPARLQLSLKPDDAVRVLEALLPSSSKEVKMKALRAAWQLRDTAGAQQAIDLAMRRFDREPDYIVRGEIARAVSYLDKGGEATKKVIEKCRQEKNPMMSWLANQLGKALEDERKQ